MPNVPTDDFKIVVRPRNVFNVSNYQKDLIHCCIRNAASVGRDTVEEDSRRQWERRIREEADATYGSSITGDYAEDGAYRRRTPPRRGGGDSLTPSREHCARSRTRSRTRSRARSRTGSRSCSVRHRSRSTAGMVYAAVAEGGAGSKHPQVSWAALASGRAPCTQPSRPETAITKNHRAAPLTVATTSQKGEAPSATRPPFPITPVSAESVKNAEEVMEAQDAQPAPTKRKALDPQQAEAKSQKREEKLRERVEALENKVVGMLAQQSQQNAQQRYSSANRTNRAVGQCNRSVHSNGCLVQARIDDIEMRLPGGAGRPVRATGKPYLRPAADEEAQDHPDGK
ncbi:hypothetical protein HPB50_020428 [Hyalomma asiaticum]|uniref:Uncharacterized protein n=1 Tax=Hyalomma asiaticum TaxID=266040 RepID=A0ACB7SYJ1_HYAAI|nr:hypothetical protein HPB50_020428 [Hyalomma asiaticum]